MAVVKKYEDLEVWRLSFKLTKSVYRVSKTGPFSRDFALRDQIRRASVSTMANITEGFGRVSPADFIRFLNYARASVLEVQCLLYIAKEEDYLTSDSFEEMYDLCDHISRAIMVLIRHLKSRISRAA